MLFSEFIQNYQGGKLDEILGAELKKLTESVQNMTRKGNLNVALELKPDTRGTMSITASYNAKHPVNNTVSGTMFVDIENQLVPNDPAQQKLELKVVGITEQTTKKVI